MRIHRNGLVRSIAFALVFMLSPAFIAVQVNASFMQDCQALITGLRADTETVVITGKNAEKNRAGLLNKLDDASTALAGGKLCTAIQKLTDFRDKVNQLIASGSINSDPTVGTTGQDLVDDANEAIACVQAMVAQNGITCPL
ncbi:MAG TPA: hypothetical protein VFD62_02050 [Pyrinomonadaceae bacterium]|nr:hypothetical protein [Pyrinomonadaceae bacterium]